MSEPYIGEIQLFAGNFAPRSWAFCDGQLLSISSNQSLFAILGTIYGGDGRTTFALPGLRGRVPIHAGSGPGLTTRNLGTRSGQATIALAASQIPAHGHTAAATSAQLRAHAGNDADQGAPAPANVLGKFQGTMIGVNAYSNSDANLVALNDVGENIVVAPAGGGQGHQNRQPFLGLNYIIALVGLFPPRN